MRWQMSAFGGKADSDQPLLANLDLGVHALVHLFARAPTLGEWLALDVARARWAPVYARSDATADMYLGGFGWVPPEHLQTRRQIEHLVAVARELVVTLHPETHPEARRRLLQSRKALAGGGDSRIEKTA